MGHQRVAQGDGVGTGEGTLCYLLYWHVKRPSILIPSLSSISTSSPLPFCSPASPLQGCMVQHYLLGVKSMLDLEFGFLVFSCSCRHFWNVEGKKKKEEERKKTETGEPNHRTPYLLWLWSYCNQALLLCFSGFRNSRESSESWGKNGFRNLKSRAL